MKWTETVFFFTFISKFQQVSNLISSSLLLLVIPHYSSGILRAVLFVAVLQRDVDLQYMRADWNVAAAAVWEAFWRELNKYQRKLKKGNDDLIFTSFGYGFIYFLFRSSSAVCRFFFFTHLTHHSSLFFLSTKLLISICWYCRFPEHHKLNVLLLKVSTVPDTFGEAGTGLSWGFWRSIKVKYSSC